MINRNSPRRRMIANWNNVWKVRGELNGELSPMLFWQYVDEASVRNSMEIIRYMKLYHGSLT